MKRKGFLNYYNQWPKEGSLFEQQYKDAPESDNPTVLLYLAHAYVSPKPMPQLAPSQASDNTSMGHVKSNPSKPGPSNNTKAAFSKTSQNDGTDGASYSAPPPYEHNVDGDRDTIEESLPPPEYSLMNEILPPR
jgi:hypothetical protein